MVIDYCTLNIQPCMVHFYVRSNTLIKMKYHSCLFDKCIMIYNHICIPILVCWIAVLPDFKFFENDQILSKIAHITKYDSKVTIVTLQSSKKCWPSTALQKDIKLEVCFKRTDIEHQTQKAFTKLPIKQTRTCSSVGKGTRTHYFWLWTSNFEHSSTHHYWILFFFYSVVTQFFSPLLLMWWWSVLWHT